MNETEIIPSLKLAAERHTALLKEAEQVYRALAKELERRIPKSMRQWANERGYIETTIGKAPFWMLPEWIDHLVRNAGFSSEWPNGNSDKYREDELDTYGFESFNHLKQCFAELANAWKGIVRIHVAEGELPNRVEVFYYAAELTPERPTSTDDEE